MKFDLEHYIITKIEANFWNENCAIPTESELIRISSLSKMSIRKVIDKLKEREILYTIQGRGVYVSPFHHSSKIEKLSDILKATKVTVLPSQSKVPQILLKRFNSNFEIDAKKTLTFVKLYFVNDEIVAFTINWLNNEANKYDLKNICQNKVSIYDNEDFNKQINYHRLEKTSVSDKNILLTKYEFVPTIYSYFINRNRHVLMIRVTKMKPRFYSSLEVKNK